MIEYKSVLLDMKALDDKTGEFTGYTTKFNEVDREGDVMLPGCYDKSIAEHKAAGTLPSLLWNHKIDQQCGDILSIDVDKVGVVIKGVVWKDEPLPAARAAWRMLKGTGVKALSSGFITRKKGTAPSGARRAIAELEHLESSLTSLPVLKSALVTDVKALESLTIREAEEILREAGLSLTEAKAFLSAVKKGLEPRRDDAAHVLSSLENLAQRISR